MQRPQNIAFDFGKTKGNKPKEVRKERENPMERAEIHPGSWRGAWFRAREGKGREGWGSLLCCWWHRRGSEGTLREVPGQTYTYHLQNK